MGIKRTSSTGGRLSWINVALSTLWSAKSPRLSAIRLNFSGWFIASVETLIEDTGDDLRWIAAEVSRIKREFKGTEDVTVVRDSIFWAALDALNVSFRLWDG